MPVPDVYMTSVIVSALSLCASRLFVRMENSAFYPACFVYDSLIFTNFPILFCHFVGVVGSKGCDNYFSSRKDETISSSQRIIARKAQMTFEYYVFPSHAPCRFVSKVE